MYAVLITSRKLRHYFGAILHKIAVVTEFPLGDILRNKEANGRIIKWAVELGTYSIEFRSRPTIKMAAGRMGSIPPTLPLPLRVRLCGTL